MRSRAVLGILTTALAFSVTAGGCQIIAQLNVLQVGMGGEGSGGGSSGSMHSSSGGGGCAGPSGCPDGSVCLPGPQGMQSANVCEMCGFSPPTPMCPQTGCDSCAQNVCLKSCGDGGACDTMLDAMNGPVQLHCAAGQCTGNFSCHGPYLCEVDCDANACTSLTLTCDTTGPCILKCAGMGCEKAHLTCGNNQCTIVAPPPPMGATGTPYSKDCKQSCGCSVQTMM